MRKRAAKCSAGHTALFKLRIRYQSEKVELWYSFFLSHSRPFFVKAEIIHGPGPMAVRTANGSLFGGMVLPPPFSMVMTSLYFLSFFDARIAVVL